MEKGEKVSKKEREERIKNLTNWAMATYKIETKRQEVANLTEAEAKAALDKTLSKYQASLPQTDEEKAQVKVEKLL